MAQRIALKHGSATPLVIADARGLVAQERFLQADLRPNKFLIDLAGGADGVELKPGEETPVTLAVPQLPRDADVKEIQVSLTVSASAETPPAETTAGSVTAGGAPAQAFSVAVTAPLLPRNVQVRLEGGEAFWTRSGTLEAGPYELPDFAPQANAYLDAAEMPPGAQTTLRFLVKSDTPGQVDIALVSGKLRYAVLQTQTWPNPLDGSVRIDRNVDLDFGRVVRFPLDPPRSALPLTGLRLDVSGEAGPERLLGDVPAHDGRQFATVSSDYAVAQGLTIAGGTDAALGFAQGGTVSVAGVTGLMAVDAEAEVHVEVRRDDAGAPAGDEPVGGVSFALAPPEGAEGPAEPAWSYAAFAQPVELTVGTPYWIVLRGVRGSARVALGSAAAQHLQALLVNRGGRLWKPLVRGVAPAPVALVRIAYVPGADDQTSALALGLAGRAVQRADPTGEVRRLALDAGAGAGASPELVVTSHARGALTLANVVQEFGP